MVSKEKKQCPYCGEEILAIAKKCKHCGEWLDEDENSGYEEEHGDEQETDNEEDVYDYSPSTGNVGKTILKRIAGTIAILTIAFLLFEFGGWEVSWGRSISHSKQLILKKAQKRHEIVAPKDKGFLLSGDGVLVRVNRKYYGFIKDKRHFDAPVIQWIMLSISISLFGTAIYFLVTGKTPDDDDDGDEI